MGSAANTPASVLTGNSKNIYPQQAFGKITVLSLVPGSKKSWNCICRCGKELQVFASRLKGIGTPAKRSCSKFCPAPRTDIAGKTFSYLKAVKFIRMDQHNAAIWQFACVCGSEVVGRASHVVSGRTKSCGCKKEEMRRVYTVLPNDGAIKQGAYTSHRIHAKARGLISYLTKDEFIKIICTPCFYCDAYSTRRNKRTNTKAKINSADRFNNESYYKVENTVSACFDCQKAKGKMTAADYIAMCARVAGKQSKK